MMVDPGGSEFPVNKLSNCHPTPIARGGHPVGTSSGLVLPCLPDGVMCVCVCVCVPQVRLLSLAVAA